MGYKKFTKTLKIAILPIFLCLFLFKFYFPLTSNEMDLSKNSPHVFLTVLARNKAHILPYYLNCISHLDYEKAQMTLYVHTNDNQDDTEELLEQWIKEHEKEYKKIIYVKTLLLEKDDATPHEWTSAKRHVLNEIRDESIKQAINSEADYYFVVDCDNFIAPNTLKYLMSLDKPIVAPLLRTGPDNRTFSANFFSKVNEYGYYENDPEYYQILKNEKTGTFKVPLIRCTFLAKIKDLNPLFYSTLEDEYGFIAFSRRARENGIDQYICNEIEFGNNLVFSEKIPLEEEQERVKLMPSMFFMQKKDSNLTQNKVLLAILARNKAHVLDRYLSCIDQLDYDKKLMTVYINTNNNTDETEEKLMSWIKENQEKYNNIIFEKKEISALETTNPHEWTPTRFKYLAQIRNKSLAMTNQHDCDFYFVVDCDNFIKPETLKELIKKNKPIIAPMLKSIPEVEDWYSNFFCAVDDNGYYKNHEDYEKILFRKKIGTFKVPLVHCTYLIDAKYLDRLSYIDGSPDYEFVIFSKSARNNGIDQYICNEQCFGSLLHFHKNLTLEEEKERVKTWMDVNL